MVSAGVEKSKKSYPFKELYCHGTASHPTLVSWAFLCFDMFENTHNILNVNVTDFFFLRL